MNGSEIQFTVYGRPQPRGSKNAVLIPKRGGGWVTDKSGRPITAAKDSNPKSGDWMNSVRAAAAEVFTGELITGPVRVSFVFYFARPKCHYGSGKNSAKPKDSAPVEHIQKPDLSKLVRCAEDALTGVVWRDDCQVVEYFGTGKHWTADQERMVVTIVNAEQPAKVIQDDQPY
jgi:Holliday junction resolvase RusA-like endonuclease